METNKKLYKILVVGSPATGPFPNLMASFSLPSSDDVCFSCFSRRVCHCICMHLVVVFHLLLGKTSLIKRYALDEFNEHETTTVGTDFLNKVEVIEHQKINVQLWDIAGQERFVGLSRVCVSVDGN
jgi:hypothetical protein